MPINTSEVLSLVSQVCEEEKLRVAMKESIKGGVLAVGTTVIGGLLGGPLGLAIGGMIGGLTTVYLSQDKFESVAAIIQNDLTPGQKERLANSFRMFLQNILQYVVPVGDLAEALKLLLSQTAKAILQIAIQFFTTALGIIFQWNHGSSGIMDKGRE